MLFNVATMFGSLRKNSMRNNRFALTLALGLLFSLAVIAQCPMCRMAAESNLEAGGSAGKGLNNGILYLLAIPYLMVFILARIWKKQQAKMDQNL